MNKPLKLEHPGDPEHALRVELARIRTRPTTSAVVRARRQALAASIERAAAAYAKRGAR